MNVTLMALLCYVAWTLVIVMTVVGYRSLLVLGAKKPADSWPRGTTNAEDPGFIRRASDASANCFENLPIFAAVVVIAGLSDQLAELDLLAPWLLGARVMQSIVHMIAVNHWMVFMRFNFYVMQIVILVWWLLKLSGLA